MDDHSQDTGFLRMVRSFWHGFSTISLATSIGAILFAVLEGLFLCAFITPPRLARLDPSVLMDNPRDDYARLTINGLRLKYFPDRALSVAYIGASSARLALLHAESPSLIQDFLSFQVGEKVRFHFLCADAETLEEAVIVSDQLPPTYRGVVVVVVSDYRDDDRSRFLRRGDRELHASTELSVALDSPANDLLLERLGKPSRPKTGIYFLDYLPFFASRRGMGVPLGRVDRAPAQAPPTLPPAVSPAQRSALAKQHERDWENAERDYELRPKLAILTKDLPVLEALVGAWKRRGVLGILLEAPENPRYQEFKGPLRDQYLEEMKDFAERAGVLYWNLNPELALEAEHFLDHVHLIHPDARFRFQAAFLRRLAPLLKARSKAARPPL